MKKILITSTDLMMVQFLLPHVRHLSQNGWEVELACSNVGGRLDEVRQKTADCTKAVHELRLRRNPLSPTNAKGYADMKRLLHNADYNIIWTNEPVMGVVTRLCANHLRQKGTKVLYMVHGFHFYTGAPLLNWMVYYPIEKLMAHRADTIVTINTEDYRRAQTFSTTDVRYIHGIGINTDRLTPGENRADIRRELGLSTSDFVVLSVGELNRNKNQRTILRAIAMLQDPSIHYILCGKGDQRDNLEQQARSLGIEANVHFLGYRRDVVDICSQADVYVMPSFREGLPVSSLEAMYCGLPLLTSNIRGLSDVNHEGKNGFLCAPADAEAFANGLRRLKAAPALRAEMSRQNRLDVVPFTIGETKNEVLTILTTLHP